MDVGLCDEKKKFLSVRFKVHSGVFFFLLPVKIFLLIVELYQTIGHGIGGGFLSFCVTLN